MKLLSLVLFALCISLSGFSQQMDALSIHHGNFNAWSPTPNGGLRITGYLAGSGTPTTLNGLRYPVKYSKQNGYVGKVKRNGAVDFLHFTMTGKYGSKGLCTESSILQVGNMLKWDSFATKNFQYEYRTGLFDFSDYSALFKNNSKPSRFNIGFEDGSYNFTGFLQLREPTLDDKDNLYFSCRVWQFGSGSKGRTRFYFGANRFKYYSFRRGHDNYYLGLESNSKNENRTLALHFNKGGRANVFKGSQGPAFVYGSCADSILAIRNYYRDSFKVAESSNYYLELDANWEISNSLFIGDPSHSRTSTYPIKVENSQLLFYLSANDSVKVGDTMLYRTANEQAWLVKWKSGSNKVEVVSSFFNVIREVGVTETTETADYYANVMRHLEDTFVIQGMNYFIPEMRSGNYRAFIATFFDNQHKLVNLIPSVYNVKYGSNGNVYYEQAVNELSNGPKLPDSILNSIDSLDRSVVVEVEKEFIYSNLITPGFSYCPGERIKVIPMSIEKFDSNNVFTMELSDSNGHFINPTVIGSLKSSSLDTVTGVVPNALGSKHYRVRLVSSSPKHIGLDNAFDVEVKEPAARPNASDVYYCMGETAVQLSPSGNGVRWYTKPSDTTGGGLTTPPTPSTSSAGITTYLVTQPDAICGISARLVDVHVQAPKGLPAFSDTYYCKDDSATMFSPMGKDIRWYTNPADTLNKGLITPPTPITTTVGTQTYLVTQYDSVCGDSSAKVKVHVQAPHQLPATVDKNYCVGDTAMALSPSGNGLIWYTNPADTSGKGSAVPPTPSTFIPGLQTYLLSTQHDTVCPVSTKLVKVDVQAPLDTPVITQKDTLLISSLSSNIEWYKNSTLISGVANDTLIHTGNGTYKVVYTDSNGCQSFDTVAIKSVSVQNNVSNELKAYPNPFASQIVVDVEGIRSAKLFNANGQLVMESRLNTLTTSSLQPGLYHLEVSTQGGTVMRKMMVKY